MTIVYPEGTPTLGNTKVKVALAVANMASPSLATEVDAATSVDLSCYFYADGWTPSGSQSKQTKKRRLCSKRDVEQLFTATYTVGALRYLHDPQGADTDTGNEGRELLKAGTKLYFIERHGKDAEDEPFAAGDRVRVHYLEVGEQFESIDTDDNGEYFILQEVAYVNDGPVSGTLVA